MQQNGNNGELLVAKITKANQMKLICGLFFVATTINAFAASSETTLSCQVVTELRNGTIVFNKKSEVITLNLMQTNELFVIGGNGEVANVFATNDSRAPGKSKFIDKTTSGKFEVDFASETFDEKTQKKIIDDAKFSLDRVSGSLFFSKTVKSINPKANYITSGTCDKANKKF